ncbi:MAG: GGDEF domain-containing protein [Desulfobacteraceae bacterium]|nr:GGDEF domain-containing protein [Desulfobacteraceae bacterium]
MKSQMNRISTRVTALFSMFFRIAERQTDHKKLTRYIVALNQKKSQADIINEVAKCFKDILNYRLFAFVIQKDNGVDVWLDPRMFKKSLEQIILKDFNIQNQDELNYLNHTFHPGEHEEQFKMDDLLSYEQKEENFHSRIYMLPQRTMYDYHDEIAGLILQSCAGALSQQVKIEDLKNAAIIDSLTGCYNRREFESQLKRNIAGALRHKTALSIFMFDLDHFKKVNDTFGHIAGDKVLKEVSELVRSNMRTGDILARYGGEEFIAILPGASKRKAIELADRLRMKIEKNTIFSDDFKIKVSASFGVSQFNPKADMKKFIQDADDMMYRAKLNGRNTVMPGLIKVIHEIALDGKEQTIQA